MNLGYQPAHALMYNVYKYVCKHIKFRVCYVERILSGLTLRWRQIVGNRKGTLRTYPDIIGPTGCLHVVVSSCSQTLAMSDMEHFELQT